MMERAARSSEIIERFTHLRRDSPDRRLIHLPGRPSLTTDDLWTAASDQQRRLAARGIDRDGLVISAAGNRPGAIALWLACRRLDAALVLADAAATPPELHALACRFGATLAVVGRDPDRFARLGQLEPYADDLTALRFTGITPAPELHAGAAVLKLTSGSTGLPKATCTTEPQIVCDTDHIVRAMDIGPDACQIAAIPISHAYGFGNLVMPLLLQGTPVVLRDGFVPHQFQSDVHAYGVRAFPGVPFMFEHLATHFEGDSWPAPLQKLISAGARLDPAKARAFQQHFGVKIHSFYGTSETGGISFDDSDDVQDEPSVGRALPGVTITLRPAAEAPEGCGRVHVSGSAVASGYVGFAPAEEGFTTDGFLTGDFGRFDSRGHLILTGRASSFINVAGRKVQPEEVERVLREMPGIADVQIVGAPDPIRGQQIVACYVTSGSDPGVLAIRRFCALHLAPYKIPRVCVRLRAIPLTARGKIDRQRLHTIALEHVRGTESGVL